MIQMCWKTFHKLVVALFLLFYFSDAYSQKGSQMFLEFGGFSKTYSANYSLKVSKGRLSYKYIRLGIAIEENRLIVPVGYMVLKGKRDHFVELSGGLSFMSYGFQFWDRQESDIFINAVAGMAYRYQPFRKSAYISIGLFPFLRWDPTPHEIELNQLSMGFKPGISIGYTIP